MKTQSLRARLTVIILAPLLMIAAIAAAWQFRTATQRAEEIFDRGLLSAALAISRDMAVSGGDALSPATRKLISDTSGGEVFYHVYAPDGVFVTGYATPPVAPRAVAEAASPVYFDARYKSRDVRVLRFRDAATISGLSGLFTITVWQDMAVRNAFARDVLAGSFAVIGLLVASVALIVWFGVRLGLRPLLDLQDAIARRTPQDLEPIRRPVPVEAQGLVGTLNALLDRVSRRISSKDEFISNAAHQLRNPIAGVLALAEAVQNAPTAEASRSRSAELVKAARDASHLTNQLLSFERARASDDLPRREDADLDALVRAAMARIDARAAARGVTVTHRSDGRDHTIRCDPVMVQEALVNLLGNALTHGGPGLTAVDVTVSRSAGRAMVRIADDGVGIAAEDRERALGRFSQAGIGPGSGLGLPIAAAVAERHGGSLSIGGGGSGASITIEFPQPGSRRRQGAPAA